MSTTYMQTTAQAEHKWHLVDAKGKVLGQLATEIATWLIGKHKPTYTPHIDAGDFVVVINANDIVVTGTKAEKKMYYDHSSFPGGIRGRSFTKVQSAQTGEVLTRAVYNMVQKNRLRAARMGRLKVYGGAEHPHQSQFSS